MAEIVNDGILKSDMTAVWRIGLEMLQSVAITAIGSISASFFSSRIGTAFSRDIRKDFYEKVLNFSITEIDKFSTASLITRTTNDISQIEQVTVMILNMLLRAPMMCVVALLQAFSTAPEMTWIIGLSVIIIVVCITLILASVMKKFKTFQKLLDKITSITRENLTGLRVIRAFNNEKIEAKKFAHTNSELTRTIIYINKIMSLTNPLLLLLFNGISLLCIWVGISLIPQDISYLGNMMAFMQYAVQVIMSFLVLTMLFMMIPRANVSATRINEVLNTTPKIKWKAETKGVPDNDSSVEFRDVDFSYGHAEQNVLSKISFKAESGKTTAIIGSTGSGKSTLINLIPRFYEPTSGKIYINGLEIENYSKEDLMNRIGYVPQRGLLFSGTIKSNIAFGVKEPSKEDIELAAKISQSEDFITKLPKTYNSEISQGGKNVSGGQKQRISIARAIAKKPEIFIFDDSFSALDMKTDKNLRKALKDVTKNAVTIIVAQRVSTIKDADQIIVLDEGKIVGKGTHKTLLKRCNVYQEIVRSQLSEKEYEKEKKNA